MWKSSGMKLISVGTDDSILLNTALSPDQFSIVSLGADESLKFCKIAENFKKNLKEIVFDLI